MREYPNKSDMKLSVVMRDSDNIIVPYLEFDWELELFTRPCGNVQTVSCKGGVLSSNAKVRDGAVIIALNKPDWGMLGDLHMKFYADFEDADFEDGYDNSETDVVKLPIKIV